MKSIIEKHMIIIKFSFINGFVRIILWCILWVMTDQIITKRITWKLIDGKYNVVTKT